MPKKKKGKIGSAFNQNSRSDRVLQDMKLRDLQIACIARGMDFQEMVESSVPELHGWFDRNYQKPQNILWLNEFDDWRELELKKKYDPKIDAWAFHPALRFGFVGKKDEDGNVIEKKKPRLKGVDKVEKPKRERLEGTKVLSGTKKAYSYLLATRHLRRPDEKKEFSPAKIVEKVIAKFPEAQEKSIKIWVSRARKEFVPIKKK